MKYKTYLAFMKAWNIDKSNLMDRTIGIWTNGPYSHVEFIVYNEEERCYKMCSALGTRDEVRCKKHIFNTRVYDYIEVELRNPERVFEFFDLIINSKYDYKGIILSQIFPLGMDNPNRWFCSESCTKAAQISGIENKELWKVKPESISPNDLAYMLGLLVTDKKVKWYRNLSILNKKNIPDIYKPFNIKKVNNVNPRDFLFCK